MLKANNYKIKRDVAVIIVSLIIAVFVWQSAVIDNFLTTLHQGRLLSAFIAGIFFTSAFTIAPAMVILMKIAQFNAVVLVAILGAAGAVIGDSFIFYFVRDKFFNDLIHLLKKPKQARVRHLLKSKIIRFSLAITGGILIALPLFPDETALALMGMSRVTTRLFILITFIFNFLAIFVLGLIASRFPA